MFNVNLSSLAVVNAVDELALWSDFAELYNDDNGCSPKDRDAVLKFIIERSQVYVEQHDEHIGFVRVSNVGQIIIQHGVERVDTSDRFIWISLSKDVEQTCIADETGAEEFLYMLNN